MSDDILRNGNHHYENAQPSGGNGAITPPPPPPPPKDHVVIPDTITPPSSSINPSPLIPQQQNDVKNGINGNGNGNATDLPWSEPAATQPSDPFAPTPTLRRAASISTLSRTTFAAQLSRLTSLSMPLDIELKQRITSLPSANEAAEKLRVAGPQIHRWIQTAKTVLRGLDAEDDVEWAAQGQQSLADVEGAVSKFGGLVRVYVSCIEEVQLREDVGDVSPKLLKTIVDEMEATLDEWKDVQDLLKGIKDQVETAMEWIELWTTIFSDIQQEIEACQTLVFEMEERRHKGAEPDGTDTIESIASIVEGGKGHNKRASIISTAGMTKPSQPMAEDASQLLGLFARMQPLRASLDFLPMRISSFQMRAEDTFPSACEDLEMRRKNLEKKWKRLESDAESLKKELGEDKWVAIFRNAGKQASKMMESVQRSVDKLKATTEEAINPGSEGGLLKMAESYEAKKTHYGPAIDRVLAIVDKGVHDRLTVNGEILRLHSDLRNHWKKLESEMNELDARLADIDLSQSQESLPVSASINGGSNMQSATTSPASSVIMDIAKPTGRSPGPPTSPSRLPRVHNRPASSLGHSYQNTRSFSSPLVPSGRPGGSRLPSGGANLNVLSNSSSRGSSPASGTGNNNRRFSYATPLSAKSPATVAKTPISASADRPRWNASTNTKGSQIGHNFKPLTLTTPSPYRRESITSRSTPKTGSSSRLSMPGSSNPGSPASSISSATGLAIASSLASAVSPTPTNKRATLKAPPMSMRRTSHDELTKAARSPASASLPATGKKQYKYVKSSGYGAGGGYTGMRPASALGKSNAVSPNARNDDGSERADSPAALPNLGLAGGKMVAPAGKIGNKRMSLPPKNNTPPVGGGETSANRQPWR